MADPAGDHAVQLGYETTREVEAGDWLLSHHRGSGQPGSWYLIEAVREVKRRNGGPRKLMLTCRRGNPGDPIPEDLIWHPFEWLPRPRSKTRRWRQR